MSDDTGLKSWLRAWVRAMNLRGVFARLSQEDKTIVDVSTTEEFAKAIKEEFGLDITSIRSNPVDPPDCFAWFNQREISIELAEFVDSAKLSNIARAEGTMDAYAEHRGIGFSETQWSKERFLAKLSDLIDGKNAKYEKIDLVIDVLVIHTDETWLSPPQVEGWLAQLTFETRSHLRNAFFLMTYDPVIKRWPIYPVFGTMVG